MSLPKLDIPIYKLTLPSTGKEVAFRPFLIKEEKILFMAYESKDPEEIKNAIKQIINNCLIDPINVDESPVFDIEWILINLRIRSVGNKIENDLICNNSIDDQGTKCNTPFKVSLDLNDIKINNGKELHYKKRTNIELDPKKKTGVILRYPRYSFVKDINSQGFDYALLKEVIESVYDANTVYPLSEQPEEDISAFFDSLSKEQYDKIVEFIQDIPKYSIDKYYKCPKCGFNHRIHSEDIFSFFT